MAPASSSRRRRRESGQMLLLVMGLLLVFAALSGFVLNVADRAHDKEVLQEAADRGAYTAAANTARGLNFVSNANLANLQITAEMAVIDAILPTVADANQRLDIWQGVAWLLQASFFPPAVALGRAIEFEVRIERFEMRLFRVLGQAMRPVLLVLRGTRLTVMGLCAPVVAALALAEAEGRKAGKDVLPRADVYDTWNRPRDVLPIPLSAPGGASTALRPDAMTHYGARARQELDKLVPPIAGKLQIAFLSNASGFYRSNAASRLNTWMRRDGVKVLKLLKEDRRVDRSFADTYFRRTWTAQADPPVPMMRALFRGGQVEDRMGAVAEALTFNSSGWNLVTPRWEAELVPVKRPYVGSSKDLSAARVAERGLLHKVQH